MLSAETRARAIHSMARNVAERFVKPVSLEDLGGSVPMGNDFLSEANRFYTDFIREQDPTKKANNGLELTQQLINLGSFRQAREFLTQIQGLLICDSFEVPHPERYLVKARIEEKLGWIADYELGYEESLERFRGTQRFLNIYANIVGWSDEQRKILSTARHFSGRAGYGLASLGVNRAENAKAAIRDFREAQEVDLDLDSPNKGAAIGFGFAWIGRCYLLLDNQNQANNNFNLAITYFEDQHNKTGDFGILAHKYLIEGAMALRCKDNRSARSHFQEAVNLRLDQAKYPKGLADGYMGLADTCLREFNLFGFLHYLRLAFQTHPYTVLRSPFGG